MEKTITFDEEYQDEDGERQVHTYSVTLRSATAEMGMRMTLLEEVAKKEAPEIKDYDNLALLASRLTQTLLFPKLVACVVANEGFEQWPPTYEQFRNLPDKFVGEWERATYELNPHWVPHINLTKEQQEQLQKKVTNSTPA